MKKHAFLIGAYKNPGYLLDLIDSLDSEFSNFYVHVNKDNDYEFTDFKRIIKDRKNIHYFSDVAVKWGGITLLKSQLILCEEALKNKENSIFHFLTGQDILIKPLSDLFKYFESSNKSYISYELMKKEEINYRFNSYHLFDLFKINPARVNLGLTLERLLRRIQMVFRFRYQKIPFEKVYMGSPWWSLQRTALEFCVNTLKNDDSILKRFCHTFAPDESIFHSILLNSCLHTALVNNNLRYIVWDQNYVGGQKLLVVDDYESLIDSRAYFARKVDSLLPSSANLIELLRQYQKKKTGKECKTKEISD